MRGRTTTFSPKEKEKIKNKIDNLFSLSLSSLVSVPVLFVEQCFISYVKY